MPFRRSVWENNEKENSIRSALIRFRSYILGELRAPFSAQISSPYADVYLAALPNKFIIARVLIESPIIIVRSQR